MSCETQSVIIWYVWNEGFKAWKHVLLDTKIKQHEHENEKNIRPLARTFSAS